MLVLGQLSFVELDSTVYWLYYSVAYLLDLRPFQIVFLKVHASVAKGVDGREAEGGGLGGRWQKLVVKKYPE